MLAASAITFIEAIKDKSETRRHKFFRWALTALVIFATITSIVSYRKQEKDEELKTVLESERYNNSIDTLNNIISSLKTIQETGVRNQYADSINSDRNQDSLNAIISNLSKVNKSMINQESNLKGVTKDLNNLVNLTENDFQKIQKPITGFGFYSGIVIPYADLSFPEFYKKLIDVYNQQKENGKISGGMFLIDTNEHSMKINLNPLWIGVDSISYQWVKEYVETINSIEVSIFIFKNQMDYEHNYPSLWFLLQKPHLDSDPLNRYKCDEHNSIVYPEIFFDLNNRSMSPLTNSCYWKITDHNNFMYVDDFLHPNEDNDYIITARLDFHSQFNLSEFTILNYLTMWLLPTNEVIYFPFNKKYVTTKNGSQFYKWKYSDLDFSYRHVYNNNQ